MSAAPTIDSRLLQVSFAAMLRDGFTGAGEFAGSLTAQLEQRTTGPAPEFRTVRSPATRSGATFVFTGLRPGDYRVTISSNTDPRDHLPPYYNEIQLEFTVPDLDPDEFERQLSDPEFRKTLHNEVPADLVPTVDYPFPPGATLIRGRVAKDDGSPGGLPLADVLMTGRSTAPDPGGSAPENVRGRTNAQGQYVLAFRRVSGRVSIDADHTELNPGQTATVTAHHPAHPLPVETTIRRGMTTTVNFGPTP